MKVKLILDVPDDFEKGDCLACPLLQTNYELDFDYCAIGSNWRDCELELMEADND